MCDSEKNSVKILKKKKTRKNFNLQSILRDRKRVDILVKCDYFSILLNSDPNKYSRRKLHIVYIIGAPEDIEKCFHKNGAKLYKLQNDAE